LKNLSLLLILISVLILSGCVKDRVKRDIPPQIITKFKTYNCGVPPARDKINLRSVTIKIIDGLYTFTPDQYGNLGDNMADIIKASGQLVEIVRFYEACILAAQEAENAVDENNLPAGD